MRAQTIDTKMVKETSNNLISSEVYLTNVWNSPLETSEGILGVGAWVNLRSFSFVIGAAQNVSNLPCARWCLFWPTQKRVLIWTSQSRWRPPIMQVVVTLFLKISGRGPKEAQCGQQHDWLLKRKELIQSIIMRKMWQLLTMIHLMVLFVHSCERASIYCGSGL